MMKGKHKMIIHMSAPEGNAYVIMGYVKSYLKRTGATEEEIEEAMVRMKSGDYFKLCDIAEEVTNGYIQVVNDLVEEYD